MAAAARIAAIFSRADKGGFWFPIKSSSRHQEALIGFMPMCPYTFKMISTEGGDIPLFKPSCKLIAKSKGRKNTKDRVFCSFFTWKVWPSQNVDPSNDCHGVYNAFMDFQATGALNEPWPDTPAHTLYHRQYPTGRQFQHQFGARQRGAATGKNNLETIAHLGQ
mmetsp:Transcript_16186/g.44554  ORF Transcript_16186/g.44554 Transcript_16186/m.44554 type:complete len:164 (+) Transcript_16186:395-886(+)